MQKPIRVLTHPLPELGEPGAFGTVRKHDIHTGVDLYAPKETLIYTMEAGTVVAVEAFTGEHADSPWWNDTWAILIEGVSGVIVYGELDHCHLQVGDSLWENELVGWIEPVLKKDKGVTPTGMLHIELHVHGTTKTSWWRHGEDRPESLLDPTELLRKSYAEQ